MMVAAFAASIEVRTKADPDVVLDLLYAPLYYRLLVGHQPLWEAFIREHVTLALNGILSAKDAAPSLKRSRQPGKK